MVYSVTFTRSQFLQDSQNRSVELKTLDDVARLKNIDVKKADLNRDGVLSGEAEANALFDELDRHDGSDRDPSRLVLKRTRQMFGLKIPFSGQKTTKVGNAVEALAVMSAPELANSASNDPFAQYLVLPKGPQKGEPVDTREKRSMRSLNPEEAKPYVTGAELEGLRNGDGTQVIANFWHDGQFWVAVVPPDAVKDLYIQQVNFDGLPAAHGQARLEMHEGKEVRLVPQVSPEGAEPVYLDNVVYSAEAAGILGMGYGLVKGMKDNFVIAHRLVSASDRANDAKQNGEGVVEFRIALPSHLDSQETRNAYFRAVLSHSTAVGMTEVYHTRKANCILAVLRPLDDLIGYKPFFINLDFYPYITRDSLDDRNVLGEENKFLP